MKQYYQYTGLERFALECKVLADKSRAGRAARAAAAAAELAEKNSLEIVLNLAGGGGGESEHSNIHRLATNLVE